MSADDFTALGITTISAVATVATAKIAADAIKSTARQSRRRRSVNPYKGIKIKRLVWLAFKKGEVPHNKGDTEVKGHFRNTRKSPDMEKRMPKKRMEPRGNILDGSFAMRELAKTKNTIHGTKIEMWLANTTELLMGVAFGLVAYFVGAGIYFWNQKKKEDSEISKRKS